jgi:hypothetical protein
MSPDDVFTFCCDGRLPVTVTATLAVRVTDPIVSDTLIVELPELQPVTSPLLFTSATALVVEVNVGEPGFEMTWFCVSNAVTVIGPRRSSGELQRSETFVWIEPSVWLPPPGGGGGGLVVPPSLPPPPQPYSRSRYYQAGRTKEAHVRPPIWSDRVRQNRNGGRQEMMLSRRNARR